MGMTKHKLAADGFTLESREVGHWLRGGFLDVGAVLKNSRSAYDVLYVHRTETALIRSLRSGRFFAVTPGNAHWRFRLKPPTEGEELWD